MVFHKVSTMKEVERKKVSNDFSSSVLQPFYFSFDVLFGLQGHLHCKWVIENNSSDSCLHHHHRHQNCTLIKMVGPCQQLRLLRTLLKIGNQWSGVSIPILSCLKGCWATVAKAWKLNKPSRGTRILFEKLLPSQARAELLLLKQQRCWSPNYISIIQYRGESEKKQKRRILVHFLTDWNWFFDGKRG